MRRLICISILGLALLPLERLGATPAEVNQGWIWNDEDGNPVNVGETGGCSRSGEPWVDSLFLGLLYLP